MTPYLLIIPDKNHQLPALAFVQKLPRWESIAPPHPDLILINQDRVDLNIEGVRNLIADLQFRPFAHTQRCFVLFHLETASLPAQQALLKSLEEPPEFVQFVITTSNLQAVLPTIQSRCLVERIEVTKFEKSIRSEQPTKQLSQQSDEPAENQPTKPPILWENLGRQSISQLIQLAEEYKDREEATDLLKSLLSQAIAVHRSLPQPQTTAAIQLLLKYLNYLSHNTNVQLTLTDCLLELNKNFQK